MSVIHREVKAKSIRRSPVLWATPVVVLLGCTEETFLNATRPLGLGIFTNVSAVRAQQLSLIHI